MLPYKGNKFAIYSVSNRRRRLAWCFIYRIRLFSFSHLVRPVKLNNGSSAEHKRKLIRSDCLSYPLRARGEEMRYFGFFFLLIGRCFIWTFFWTYSHYIVNQSIRGWRHSMVWFTFLILIFKINLYQKYKHSFSCTCSQLTFTPGCSVCGIVNCNVLFGQLHYTPAVSKCVLTINYPAGKFRICPFCKQQFVEMIRARKWKLCPRD